MSISIYSYINISIFIFTHIFSFFKIVKNFRKFLVFMRSVEQMNLPFSLPGSHFHKVTLLGLDTLFLT